MTLSATLPRNPLIYEINTWIWLAELSAQAGKTAITLADVPDAELDRLAALSFNAVWLMGMWERSKGGQVIARTHPGLQGEYAHALPDYTWDDVVGSPYAVSRYAVAEHFGGRAALATLRHRLADRGMRLILDFVPNHVAIDHHWTLDCPDCLVNGTQVDLTTRPGSYFQVADNGRIIAHGRDPFFPAWTDTAQIDAFSEALRERARATLLDIADQCDGVRCDMAMLVTNRVFAQTWGHTEAPATDYWQTMIPAVKAEHPAFIFMAEVYWDMEHELLAQGFDYTYDKRLYDRMRDGAAAGVRDHLLAGIDYQRGMVRFIENHDEGRALTTFGLERSRAAAALTVLLPGASLIHEGQIEGRGVKIPVQLGRRVDEPIVTGLPEFYRALIAEAAAAPYHEGAYMALAANPILGRDPGPASLIAFAWVLGADWRIVAVNFSDAPITVRLFVPNPDRAGTQVVTLTDALTDETIQINGDDLLTAGLSLTLHAFGIRIMRVNAS